MNDAATTEPLLHLTTAAPWRMALDAGSLTPPSFVVDGFVHLSAPEQVALPAGRLFAGRDDVLLLVVDPGRLGGEVRWEPGVPSDPASMRFPHLYAPLPAAAVSSAVPYRPGTDGLFAAPAGLPAAEDLAARARAFDRSLAERRAAAVLPVPGGVACVDPRVPHSYEHNTVWMSGAPDAATISAAADAGLGGYQHRRVVLDGPPPPDLGWGEVDEERILVLAPDADTPAVGEGDGDIDVVALTGEVMGRLWARSWRRSLPGVSDQAVDDLVRRESFADAHVRIVDLGVLGGDGVPVAGTQLRIDGATAAIEAVMTEPDARGRGYGTALVGDAVRRARAAGCDCIWLIAVADDWPRRWYERLGFRDVGARWVVTRR